MRGYRRHAMVLGLLLTSLCSGSDMPIVSFDRNQMQDFDRFRGTHQSLPAGFAVFKADTLPMGDGDEDFRGESAGGVTTGGCYAWRRDTNNLALGYQPTSDEFTPGAIVLSVSNATGQIARRISIAYAVVFLNNADRSSCMELQWSRDDAPYLPVAGTTMCTPTARTERCAWSVRTFAVTLLLEPPLPTGGRLCLRWRGDDGGGAGSRDEYGIDDVRIRLRPSAGTLFAVQ